MRRLVLLGVLYINQGLPYGFFLQTLPVLMRQEGASAREIGALSFLALPWVLKILWAPFVDRTADRRTWIVGLQALLPFLVALLAFTQDFYWIAVGVLALNLVVATVDIAVDGLAVETLAMEERGWGNALQAGGYKIGLIVGGGLLPGFFLGQEAALGWMQTLLILALLLVPAVLVSWQIPAGKSVGGSVGGGPVAGGEGRPVEGDLFGHRSPAEGPIRETHPKATHRNLWKALFSGPGAWLIPAFALFSKFGDSVGTSMFRVLLVDRGWPADRIALTIGTWGLAASIIGSFLAALPLRRYGHRPAFYLFGGVQAGFFFLLSGALVGNASEQAWGILLIVEHFVSGLVTTALFTLFMDHTPIHSAGSGFTAFAILSAAGMGLGSLLGGVLVDFSGFLTTFLVAGTTAFAPLVFLALSGRGSHAKRIPDIPLA